MPATVDLRPYLGKHISEICKNDYHNDADNHCAHFVSHALGFRYGFKCRDMTGKGHASTSANIRVHEIFARCRSVGEWSTKPADMRLCLAFVTSAANVNLSEKRMRNHPKKHIGVFLNGKIFHYSNSRNRVVEQSPLLYAKHYAGNDVQVFYGSWDS